MPQLSRALAEKGSGDIEVFVKTTGLSLNSDSKELSATSAQNIPSNEPGSAKVQEVDAISVTDSFDKASDNIANVPITPETGSNWPIFRFLLALLVIAILVYFFFHHR